MHALCGRSDPQLWCKTTWCRQGTGACRTYIPPCALLTSSRLPQANWWPPPMALLRPSTSGLQQSSLLRSYPRQAVTWSSLAPWLLLPKHKPPFLLCLGEGRRQPVMHFKHLEGEFIPASERGLRSARKGSRLDCRDKSGNDEEGCGNKVAWLSSVFGGSRRSAALRR